MHADIRSEHQDVNPETTPEKPDRKKGAPDKVSNGAVRKEDRNKPLTGNRVKEGNRGPSNKRQG